MVESKGSREGAAGRESLVDSPSIALKQALDRIQCGVIITPSSMYPSFVNVHARQILDRRDGLFLSEQGLHASRPEDRRRLRDLVQRSAAQQLERSVAVTVARAETARAFTVYVTPCKTLIQSVGQAILFICDPDHPVVVDRGSLSALFGLTRAEAVFAELMMQGRSVETAADDLRISINTARTHLKRILFKTDTGRQGELVRVLMRCSGYVNLGW
jgi:DNA-binding CsgD family transcriptional regulator